MSKRTWTQSAYECYSIGSDCSQCPTNKAIGHANRDYGLTTNNANRYGCHMPETLRQLGEPPPYSMISAAHKKQEEKERTEARNGWGKPYESALPESRALVSSIDIIQRFIDYYSSDTAEEIC